MVGPGLSDTELVSLRDSLYSLAILILDSAASVDALGVVDE
jgi:hypothetical protein